MSGSSLHTAARHRAPHDQHRREGGQKRGGGDPCAHPVEASGQQKGRDLQDEKPDEGRQLERQRLVAEQRDERDGEESLDDAVVGRPQLKREDPCPSSMCFMTSAFTASSELKS